MEEAEILVCVGIYGIVLMAINYSQQAVSIMYSSPRRDTGRNEQLRENRRTCCARAPGGGVQLFLGEGYKTI